MKFYEKKIMLEHPCCWETAICKKVEKGKGMYGSDEALVLECNICDVEFILECLNSTEDCGKTQRRLRRG